ncbi:MAG: ABC transporter substrate-binding protein [Rhodopila sp.]
MAYSRSYPRSTVDFSPTIRAIQATNPDMVFVASYPPDTVGMVRAAAEVGLKTKIFDGAMVGLQSTSIKLQLGPLMNGVVNFDSWLPAGSFAIPEAMDFRKRYQAKAARAGVDVLGYYLPPFAYADMQVLQAAVEGTNSLDQEKLAEYLRSYTFHTVIGDVTSGPDGEWTELRIIEVQFQNVKSNNLEQFKDPKTEVILYPPPLNNGDIVDPYLKVRE